MPASSLRRLAEKGRGPALLVVAVAGALYFLSVVRVHQPLDTWLFWVYARIWAMTLAFGLACLSTGDLLVAGALGWRARPRERLVVSFAVGAFVFAGGVFVVGLLDGLGPVFFVAWPLILILTGARRLMAMIRRGWALLRHARKVATRPTLLGGLILAFGLAGVLMLYVNILTPGNAAFDSRWYHLGIAEHYAASGGISRFPEGWFCATYPHLASLFYTWAFLYPDANLFAHVELAAHVEFLLFVVTLAGVGVLARWLCASAGVAARHAWAAVFLFPGILLYDSSLSIAADHVLAFWAPVIFLLARRLWRTWDDKTAALLGLMMAGAVMTKYQAIYLVVPTALAMLVRAARATRWFGRARSSLGALGAAVRPVVVVGLAALILSTPLWLKNWVWYGDPVYPMLHEHFAVRPWVPGTDPDKFLQVGAWTPQGTLPEKVLTTAKATLTFSFTPHDWGNLHGVVPVFGSLFTLSLPLLLFVRRRRRVAVLAGATMLGLFIWYWTYHQDRYLQALLPWMAAVVAGTLARAWQAGGAARAGVSVMVAAQILWGGDVWLYPTHAMMGQPPVKTVIDMISAGYRHEYAMRTETNMDLGAVAPLLPKTSKVLIHERWPHLGIGHPSVTDGPGTQAGISYDVLRTPDRVWARLHDFGVTHVLWAPNSTNSWGSVAWDLVFHDFAEGYLGDRRPVAGMILAPLGAVAPPPVAEPRLVRLETCGPKGVVALDQVDDALAGKTAQVTPAAPGGAPPAFVVTQAPCGVMPPDLAPRFRMLVTHAPYQLWGPTAH